ncbi:molybdopterin-dependent oxidoreductase [Psychromicrobium xiongbiense]|uniref:molybdopterin-dependent oxidoreductase n=1 Tax=Psychromicrobium xiongbiense TaxID=3051184 RepID=UPI0025548EFC|nr:molybdopterin-dependent oxidoreductase [Psychromicrobium sp. YIM S02556]
MNTPRAGRWWAALSGLLAVGLGLLLSEVTAGLVSPSVSPVTAVGSAVIDVLPPGLKEGAISLFGTSDKLVFLVTLSTVVAILAALAGVLEYRRRYLGLVVIALFGVLGVVAILSRSAVSAGQSATAALLAPGVAVLVGMAALRFLLNRLQAWQEAATRQPAAHSGPERRIFLRSMAIAAAGGLMAALVTGVVRSSQAAYQAARARLKLPVPQSPAPAIPAGAVLPVAGISDLVTANPQFYRIDTALSVPQVNPDDWKLTVTGLVNRQVSLNLADLLAKPLVERYVTIACVSNEVGGDLIGNARWLGWPVRELLAEAGVAPGADMVLSRSVDGFTASTPLEAMLDARDALVVVGMNGELLPLEHGFPVRLIVPGLYGFVSATKWLTELKVTTFAADTAYWSSRGWSDHGMIKSSSRIDTPVNGSSVPVGSVTLGGVAWAPEQGIRSVEVKVDDGAWQAAELGSGISRDTWLQWRADVRLTAGQHRLQVRCTDGNGQLQSSAVAPPAPDGSSGYHQISVTAH